jgi:hypothetical protein
MFTPFGVLLAHTETADNHTYALLALVEAAKRVLCVTITIRAQSTDAHLASIKTAETFKMQFSSICFPHVVRCACPRLELQRVVVTVQMRDC